MGERGESDTSDGFHTLRNRVRTPLYVGNDDDEDDALSKSSRDVITAATRSE